MTQGLQFRKLLREPLIHFLGGALLVFGFFWATGTDRDPANYAIIIDEADISRLTAGWAANFRRPPTQDELDGMIDKEIVEEIYYREALRLGLDRNDPVVRRRLFTKMRFLNTEETAGEKPSDMVLQQWMDDHPGKYILSSQYDLEQIYLGQSAPEDIAQVIERLNSGEAKSADIAKPISLPATLSKASSGAIDRQFGERFTKALEALEASQWQGPIRSGFGRHLVKITAKTPGKQAQLSDVRQQVSNDWRAAQNAAAEARSLAKYRALYDVTVAGRE